MRRSSRLAALALVVIIIPGGIVIGAWKGRRQLKKLGIDIVRIAAKTARVRQRS